MGVQSLGTLLTYFGHTFALWTGFLSPSTNVQTNITSLDAFWT